MVRRRNRNRSRDRNELGDDPNRNFSDAPAQDRKDPPPQSPEQPAQNEQPADDVPPIENDGRILDGEIIEPEPEKNQADEEVAEGVTIEGEILGEQIIEPEIDIEAGKGAAQQHEQEPEPPYVAPSADMPDEDEIPGASPPLKGKLTPGGDNRPGDLADPEEQKKLIRYFAEERPWMREQLQKDQERDENQFKENAMQQEAEEIERPPAGQAPHPDDAGAVLDEPAPDDTRTPDNERQRDKSSSPAHEDDAGAVLDEPAPTPSRDRDNGMDID